MTVLRIVAVPEVAPEWARSYYVDTYVIKVVDLPNGQADFITSPTRADAYEYATPREALDEWNRVHSMVPFRPDGKANKPLTAFTVEVVP